MVIIVGVPALVAEAPRHVTQLKDVCVWKVGKVGCKMKYSPFMQYLSVKLYLFYQLVKPSVLGAEKNLLIDPAQAC